jgi:hypothetical protein
MAKMSLGQAAKAGFASRASIYRDAAAGKLSIEVEGDRKLVELSELVRVYGELSSRPLPADVVVAAPDLPKRVDLERRVAELEAAKAGIEAELRAERAASRDAAAASAATQAGLISLAELAQRQAADATKLLTDMRASAARPWWRKLLGRTAILGLALCAFVGAGDARGQGLETGNDFLPHCKTEAASWQNGLCLGMIRGISDLERLLPPAARFCPPSAVTRGQMVRVVVAFLERNPAFLHERFSSLVVLAFRDAWPCR